MVGALSVTSFARGVGKVGDWITFSKLLPQVVYPFNIAVGGVVGMIGGLGGFILPICFGVMNDLIGVFTSCFMLLFAITAIAFVWMHISIVLMEKDIVKSKFLPELNKIKQGDTQINNKNPIQSISE